MEKLFSITRSEGRPPFTLVHGWMRDRTATLPVASAFRATDRRSSICLAVTEARKQAITRSSAPAAAALDVAPERSIWAGHSMTAQMSITAAVAAPERVAGLVLPDPAFFTPHKKAIVSGASGWTKLARFDIPSMMDAFVCSQV